MLAAGVSTADAVGRSSARGRGGVGGRASGGQKRVTRSAVPAGERRDGLVGA
jgi:hypothetical protein